MSDSPYKNYWIAAVIVPGYLFLFLAFYYYKRKISLEERGRRTYGNIIKLWVQQTDKGRHYWATYRFTHNDFDYERKAQYSRSVWNTFQIGTAIDIIYDPQNPRSYNIPFSEMNKQCCYVIGLLIFSLAYILGFGLGFGIGMFQFIWYHILITMIIIPCSGFIIIALICCPICYKYHTKKTASFQPLLDQNEGQNDIEINLATTRGNDNDNGTDFSGIWIHKSSKNQNEYYKSEGYNWMKRKIISHMKQKQIITQNGNNMNVECIFGSAGNITKLNISVVIGSDKEYEFMDPNKGLITAMSLWNSDKTKIITNYYYVSDRSKSYYQERYLSGNNEMIVKIRNNDGKEIESYYQLENTVITMQ